MENNESSCKQLSENKCSMASFLFTIPSLNNSACIKDYRKYPCEKIETNGRVNSVSVYRPHKVKLSRRQ